MSAKRIERVYPLSPMQSGMLFHALKNENSRAYFEQIVLTLKGEIDRDLFEQSFNLLFDRHEILRTIFRVENVREPLQFVLKKRAFRLHYEDLSGLNEEQQRILIDRFIREDRDRGFDLGRDILMRAALFKTGPNVHALVWSMHHILMDGWCLGLIYRELLHFYHWLKEGKRGTVGLESVPPYLTYIKWLEKQDQEEGLNYWRKYLEGCDRQTVLPQFELSGSEKQDRFQMGEYTLTLGEKETSGLKEMAAKNQVTESIVFQTLWGILLQKYNNSDDVVFGVVVSGRSADIEGIERMVGLFINTLPVRITSGEGDHFLDVLNRVRQNDAVSRSYEYTSLASIQAESPLKGDLIHHIMAFQNYPVDEEIRNAGLNSGNTFWVEDIRDIGQTNYNFNITIIPREGFQLKFDYNALVYEKDLIKTIGMHLQQLIGQILDNSSIPVKGIDILTSEERRKVLFDFNQTTAEYPRHKTIQALFEEQVERAMDHVALAKIEEDPCVHGLGGGYLSYGVLDAEANRLAHNLKKRGVHPEEILGIMAEPSLEMVIGILGILKAGAGYLPIEPDYPRERSEYMLAESKVRFLVITQDLSAKISIDNCQMIIIASNNNEQLAANNSYINKNNLAYVIYTSGSTGRPKGVLVGHQSLVNLCYWHNRFFSISSVDRAAKLAGFGFDASVWEIFPYLIAGACLYMVPPGIRADIYRLNKFFETHYITAAFLPTQLCEQFIVLKNRSLRLLLTGGDKLNKYIQTSYRLVNNYGPTESTVVATSFAIVGPSRNIPIGPPISNTRIYILDRYHQLQPPGVPGELCITGDSLATGYLNNPELTMERFINHILQPTNYRQITNRKSQITDIGVGNKKFLRGSRGQFFQKAPPGCRRQKTYKTGDLACWLKDGNLTFLGRLDHQVKIRGFRIELGEIETQLLNYKKIKQAVVLLKKNESGDKYLCAYILPVAGSKLRERELKEHLSRCLPDYMIPSWFVMVERIPLTANGKIDRGALPDPETIVEAGYVEPLSEVEKKLASIWQEVLELSRFVGIDDNFFQLGGHSLKAMLLTSKIHKELEIKIPLEELFKRPTIRGLAAFINEAEGNRYTGIIPVEKREYYSLSSAQKRLYFLQQMDSTGTSYNMPVVLPLRKNIEIGKLESVLKKLIANHESLRTSFAAIQELPVQRIHPADSIDFSLDYFEADTGGANDIVKKYIRPFDLGQAPLIRSAVIKMPGNSHTWLVDMHHIISDGTSHTILIRDFLSFYNGMEPDSLRLQYKDFSQWQNQLFAGGGIKNQEDYWHSLYADARDIPRLNLPLDFKRPEVFTFTGDRYDFVLARETALAFKALGVSYGATLYMNMLAVLNTLFYKYTGQTDIIIGSGIAGRPHADLQPLVGMFVNTLAMRNYPAGQKTFAAFLMELVSSSIRAFENQDLQFEELVDQLDLERDPARNPLFDISMVVQNFGELEDLPLVDKDIPGLTYRNPTTKFDMTFFIREDGDDVYIFIEYYTAIFKRETIARMVSHLEHILQAVIRQPLILLDDIDIIPGEEKQKLLFQFNDTAWDNLAGNTLHGLFLRQAEKTPDYAALVYDNEILTYGELNRQANRIARYLCYGKGLARLSDVPVGLLLSGPLHQGISIIGILKAGAAYVPLDPLLPQERIKYMINDACLGVIISEKKYINLLNRLQWECQCFHTYLCPDSRDILREEEAETSELMSKELWHHVGESADDEITGGGWVSSFTGEPMSRAEMEEYGDNILMKLKPLLHNKMRVLEIGCASGISMFRIAPRVALYYGTDLSEVIIDRDANQVVREGHNNIKLACLAAHDIDRLEERDFDLIIMNSVIQCFHGHNYLRKVMRMAVNLLGEQGYLFVGDVMDQEKKELLVQELAAFKLAHRDKTYKTKTDLSAELFTAREFWEDLGAEIKEIEEIRFSDKIYTIENELTRYRYDILIRINKQASGINIRKSQEYKKKFQDDESTLSQWGYESHDREVSSHQLAYIIYTSGTTGNPRGVEVLHRGAVNTLLYRKEEYGMEPGFVSLQLFSYSFDGYITSFFTPIISGARNILLSREEIGDLPGVRDSIARYCVTHFISVPPLYSALLGLVSSEDREDCKNLSPLKTLRTVTLAGDKVIVNLLEETAANFETLEIANEYGVTECSVMSSIYRHQERDKTVKIGHPIWNTGFYVLDMCFRLQPIGVSGEICISGTGLARGYLNYPELTKEKFCLRRPGGLFSRKPPPWTPHKSFWLINKKFLRGSRGKQRVFSKRAPGRRRQKIYKTGDLARWLPDGCIEFLGRIDFQVKIRGFRIELGEIENQLLRHDLVREVIVIDRTDENSDTYLCAYVIPKESFDFSELKEFLSHRVQDYMVPHYFISLDKIPLTPNGKVNRKALPAPQYIPGNDYIGPGNDIEKQLVEIWSETLNIEKEKISIEANFFELGGHSLKATILTSKIHKKLKVKIPLTEVFKTPTIKGLAKYTREVAYDKYASIEPVEKKEYYPLSSAQKRLYFIQQMDINGTGYNMPLVLSLGRDIETEKLESILKKLIARHESLRTSFQMLNESPVQQIHHVDDIDFSLDYFEGNETAALDIAKHYIKPFHLGHAPLLRSGVIRLPGHDHIWVVDTHHIISDGTSHAILIEDFLSLYKDKELEPLRLQYNDFSQWQNRLFAGGGIKSQEDYWHSLYADAEEIPRLNLPLDFKRPEMFTFAGDCYDFLLEREDSREFNALGTGNGATLYMNMLAVLDILFYKYTGQTDIIIGSGIAGRPHADLQNIVGMFVNTLAMRNNPAGGKTYDSFLKEIVSSSIKAFENQDLQFEELVDQLALVRDPSRNPLFDITMVVQNFKMPEKADWENQNSSSLKFRKFTSKFDMTFFIYEMEENIYFSIEYYTAAFSSSTIQRLASHLKNIIKAVIANPLLQLKDIEMLSLQEKNQVLYEFNSTTQVYNLERPIHELFEEQVKKTPDKVAVVSASSQLISTDSGKCLQQVTYKQLDESSNRLARYLSSAKEIRLGDSVAILLTPSLDRPVSILGILKAGGVYVPIDPSAPLERIKYMLDDAAVTTVISEKKFLKQLNRLQWECKTLHTYLCLDSFAVHKEEEPGKNELMDEELWHHVGENAVDDITGGGWVSSYTGEPFSREEMDEYGDNILKKLHPLLHPDLRVLEIGCASGISMFRIAPLVGFYYGTDLSRVIIAKNQELVENQGHHNIKLSCLAAHEVRKLQDEEKPFDLVIINSVIQCFHGHNYLRHVIRTAIDLLGEKGYLFVGDVMDLHKKKALIRDLTAFKNAHRNTDKAYTTKTDFSSELFIAREFFTDLQVDIEEITTVEFTEKIHTIKNELTEFRYDALFSINKQFTAPVRRAKAKFQDDLHVLSGFETDSFHLPISSGSPAYIIYTSGTTGQPRGVVIEHGSLVNLCCWHNRLYQVSEADNATLYAGFAFDASVWELFPYLIKGASLHVIADSMKLDIDALNDYYEQQHITIGFLPTQMCEQFMEKDNRSLRLLLTGGDKLRKFAKKNYHLYNNYGPTENTVVTTYYRVDHSLDNIPIGTPIDNVEIYILQKESLLPQPIGIAGELCISGPNLSRGYLNFPELTNEKFSLRPGGLFSRKPPPWTPYKSFWLINKKFLRGSRGKQRVFSKRAPGRRRQKIYKTGDLGRWLEEGCIEFLGRMDFQVKIRGFRIELGEIETRLLQHDLVREAIVIDFTDENNDTYLCAYIIPAEGFDLSELKEFLAQRVQDYMIPHYFISLDRIPLTSSGKVDRKALPRPGIVPGNDYAAPQDDIERKCTEIWAEILQIDKEKISIAANFFELGGHSLKATILASKIHKEFNVKIPLAEIFKNPTIKGIAKFIKEAGSDEFIAIKPIEKKDYYELSHAQKRLWILDRMQKGQTAYNIPGYHEFTGLDKDAFEKAIQALVKRHDILRTSFITVKGDPKQKIHHYETLNFKNKYLDLRGKENRHQIAARLKEEERSTSFDLERDPLLRVKLIHIEENRHIMIFTMHHIISDGWSMNILTMEFLYLYDSYCSGNGNNIPLAPLRIQYKEYTRWHLNQLSGENLEKHQNYWWNQLKGEIPVLELHTDYPRANLRTFAGEYLRFSLSKEISQQLKQLSIRHDSSLFITFLAIVNVFLYKYTQQHDIIVGTPAAGRVHRDLENQIGFYVNMLALRNKLNQEQSFPDVLLMVKHNTTAALEHQVYPFNQLVEDLKIKRDLGRNPLYDIVVTAATDSEQPGNTSDDYVNESGTGKHDLRFKINGLGQHTFIDIQYNPGLFKKERIIILKELLINLITDILANSNEKIGHLNFMAEFEKKQTVKKFQGGF